MNESEVRRIVREESGPGAGGGCMLVILGFVFIVFGLGWMVPAIMGQSAIEGAQASSACQTHGGRTAMAVHLTPFSHPLRGPFVRVICKDGVRFKVKL